MKKKGQMNRMAFELYINWKRKRKKKWIQDPPLPVTCEYGCYCMPIIVYPKWIIAYWWWSQWWMPLEALLPCCYFINRNFIGTAITAVTNPPKRPVYLDQNSLSYQLRYWVRYQMSPRNSRHTAKSQIFQSYGPVEKKMSPTSQGIRRANPN